jgi:hypothetical protein
MKKLALGLVAALSLGVGAFAVDARAGAVIEDQRPVPFRTAPVTLSSRYALASGVVTNPGSYVLEFMLLPAVQVVHGAVIEELVVNFYQVDPATKALTPRGSHKATIEVSKAEAGRRYSFRDLGYAHGHAVALHTEQGALHGALAGTGASIRFVLPAAPAAPVAR